MDGLKITQKGKNQLEVWVNQPKRLITIKCGKEKTTREVLTSHIDFNQPHEIQLTYGINRYDSREIDEKKIKKISFLNTENSPSMEPSKAVFLYLKFPENTKIGIGNYD